MQAKEIIRILIVDDHAIVREGLKQILSDDENLVVAGEAENAAEAMRLAREKDFDLVLLDISLPDRDGLELLESLKKEHPKLGILMLSMYRETQYAVRAIKSGASGYLNKQSAPDQLVSAIKQVVTGRKFITPSVAEALALEISVGKDTLPHETLSNREFQTLCLLASGKPVSAIAEKLSLSVKTVSMYRTRLLEKMHLKNNAELTHYAIRHGLVE
ncbi:MAG: response regulator transcription factor [Hydrogenophilaceae bacterium]|jgi:two-component system invasion response regulator UvrY|nr:response regulator transcription factor [Hydrogenophilaceae bacterium]